MNKTPIFKLITVPVLVTLLAHAPHAAAQAPCSDVASHEFDFWLGEWEAFDSNDGTLQGREHVTKDFDGCVLIQNWRQQSDRYKHPQSRNRMRGTSLTARNGNTSPGVWWQTWVDNVGSVIVVTGGLKDGVMVLEGVRGNSSMRRKWHWKPLDDGSVRSWGIVSSDGGSTWQTTWDITYRRPANPS